MTQSGRVVDTATASFTTDEEPYTGPAPSISFNFGGSGATNFRMSYTGVESINVSINLAGSTDVDHVRSGLDPFQRYEHTATRRGPVVGALNWNILQELRVTAAGPEGVISINYPDFEEGVSEGEVTRAAYAARGWLVDDTSSPAANISATRGFGPGTYT